MLYEQNFFNYGLLKMFPAKFAGPNQTRIISVPGKIRGKPVFRDLDSGSNFLKQKTYLIFLHDFKVIR
jgi:hypothetical protein